MQLDEIDVKILGALIADSRLSSRQIAKKCGISIGTVLSRIRKMEAEGIIKGYTVLLDQEKLGYELTVVTEITVSKGRLLEMENEIARIPNVCCVYDLTGLSDSDREERTLDSRHSPISSGGLC